MLILSETISEKTTAAGAMLRGKQLHSSETVAWKSLHMRVIEATPVMDELETMPTPDPMVLLVMGLGGHVEYVQNGNWRGTTYGDGTGCVVAGDNAMRLRWNLPSRKPLTIAHVYIPRATATRVASELAEAGIAHNQEISDRGYLDQDSINSSVRALIPAIQAGAPEFFAQIAAQWLALQLLVPTPGDAFPPKGGQKPSDFRLARVLEYMEANLAEPLSLEVLAREAGISRFHFIGLFRRSLGMTPHKHLLKLRTEIASSMLLQKDKGILEIALACGFQSSSHFAAVFKQHYAESPTAYRLRLPSA